MEEKLEAIAEKDELYEGAHRANGELSLKPKAHSDADHTSDEHQTSGDPKVEEGERQGPSGRDDAS